MPWPVSVVCSPFPACLLLEVESRNSVIIIRDVCIALIAVHSSVLSTFVFFTFLGPEVSGILESLKNQTADPYGCDDGHDLFFFGGGGNVSPHHAAALHDPLDADASVEKGELCWLIMTRFA
jgi:hypothetical protein